MFYKLLSNLPFNPSLINQVAFYAKRLRQESSIRRMGFIMLALTMLIQLFAVISPAQPSLAQTNNDIIPGGFGSQSAAVSHCQNNDYSYKQILARFNITCDNVSAGSVQWIHSTDYNKQLYSLGRLPYNKAGEVPVQVNGIAGNFYMRYLWSWDTHGASAYQAVVGHSSTGAVFMLLFDCGNVVIVGPPSTPPPVVVPPPPAKCPLDSSLLASDSRCTPCTYNDQIITSSPSCQPPVCPLDHSISSLDARCTTCPYDTSILKGNVNCARCTYQGLGSIASTDVNCKPRCTYDSTIAQDSPLCKPCKASQNQNDAVVCLVLSKSAQNLTRTILNADGSTAEPSDVIEYTLSASNTGKATVKGYVVQENIGDVLDYADVIDFHGASEDSNHLVSWPKADLLPGQTVQKRLTIKVKSTIPVTNTPSANPGSFDCVMTNVYNNAVNIKVDCPIVKQVEVVTTTKLADTGPGTSIAIGFGLTVIVGYFFARSRLMTKELDAIRVEYTSSGGSI